MLYDNDILIDCWVFWIIVIVFVMVVGVYVLWWFVDLLVLVFVCVFVVLIFFNIVCWIVVWMGFYFGIVFGFVVFGIFVILIGLFWFFGNLLLYEFVEFV